MLTSREICNQFPKASPLLTPDVDLRINGAEIDFGLFAKVLFERVDRLTLERARDILRERIGDISDSLDKIEEIVDQRIEILSKGAEKGE